MDELDYKHIPENIPKKRPEKKKESDKPHPNEKNNHHNHEHVKTSHPNRIQWDWKKYDKTIRLLQNKLKRQPKFTKKIIQDLKVKDGNLFYKEKEIIPKDKVFEKIQEYDRNPRFTGGIHVLHHHLMQNYVGISRSDVENYITNSETHQLHKPKPKKIVHKAIVTSAPGKIAQIDLVDMGETDQKLNNNCRYILTYIDLFSKYKNKGSCKSY